MQRGDLVVGSISATLAAIVVAAVTYSVLVLDRMPLSSTRESERINSSSLVVSWGPSLCKVAPSTVGCESGHVGGLGRTMLLHGLWPQPATKQYCGVAEEVADRARNTHGANMPAVVLREDVRNSLASMVSDVAAMTSHEWYAHGTCSGVTPDIYFGDSVAFTGQVRRVLDPVFQAASGKRIAITTVRDVFDSEFGEGAGARVRFTCRNVIREGGVIFEVQLSLPAVTDLVTENTLSLGHAMLKAPTMSGGCQRAHVP